MNVFESAAGVGTVSRAEPVAWLDYQTVVVQVRGQDTGFIAGLQYHRTGAIAAPNATAALGPVLDAFSPKKQEAEAGTGSALTVEKIFKRLPEALESVLGQRQGESVTQASAAS